ncbi:MAG: class I fructose-bisphosphate aldolase [Burkholderiales bacterium]
MGIEDELQSTIEDLVQDGKGILAADESHPTIAKRFAQYGIESTPESRRAYRSLLLSAQGMADFISGVILFEETLLQRDDQGRLIPEMLSAMHVVPGIKVDRGTVALANSPGDKITEGLDGLAGRLAAYRAQGARFAKWREVYAMGERNPSPLAVEANAETLARYAAICQGAGLVPIVEPEVLIDGDHDMNRCLEVTESVLHAVFHALCRHGVVLEHMVLKPSMVLPGKDHPQKAAPELVAEATIRVLRRAVPAAVPSINFLSGGQGPEEATANLNAMNRMLPNSPWALSFSYGRALQQPALAAWAGKSDNANRMQHAFLERARLNGLARRGKYAAEMES